MLLDLKPYWLDTNIFLSRKIFYLMLKELTWALFKDLSGNIPCLKEQHHGFNMILRGSKTYLDLRKSDNNGLILDNSTREMIRTHLEVKMATDG